MTVPSGYFYKDGWYWKTDASGPYVFDGSAMALAASGSGINRSYTSAELASPSGLTEGLYSPSDAPEALGYATDATTIVWFLGSGIPRFRGIYTLAQVLAIATPTTGDTAYASDIAQHLLYTGSKWRALHEQSVLVADRVQGTATASAQTVAGWKKTFVAGELALYSSLEMYFNIHQVTGTEQQTLNVYLGTLGTSSDADLGFGLVVTASGQNGRMGLRYDFRLGASNTLRPKMLIVNTGMYAGSNSTSTNDNAEVTLSGSDDFTDTLILAPYLTMGVGSTTPHLTLDLKLVP